MPCWKRHRRLYRRRLPTREPFSFSSFCQKKKKAGRVEECIGLAVPTVPSIAPATVDWKSTTHADPQSPDATVDSPFPFVESGHDAYDPSFVAWHETT